MRAAAALLRERAGAIAALEDAEPGDRILLAAFGEGCGDGVIRLVIGFTVDKPNRQPHGFCKVKVTLVVCGYGHDGTGSVAG
mgnify:CR=1 FL=1